MSANTRSLLIVEDDVGLQKQLRWSFDEYDVILAGDRASALAELRQHQPAVVLQDLGLPPDAAGTSEGFATIAAILEEAPYTQIIVATGNGDRDNAVKAIGAGAYDFCPKPLDLEVLRLIVDRAFRVHELEAENRKLRSEPGTVLEGIIGTSEAMAKACRLGEKVGPTNASVLLLGETGTGKELVARAVHRLSTRRDGPFVAINCSATRRAPTPVRTSRPRASSNWPAAAACCWTRSATCRCRCRRSCCVSCRIAWSSASVGASR